MANVHKSIEEIQEIIKGNSKAKAEKKIEIILKSFLQQSRYGIPLLSAFENSVYNPSLRENTKKEKELKLDEKKNNSLHFRLMNREINTIKELLFAGNGCRKIASFLNSFRFTGTTVSHDVVCRFINENNLR